jgi:polyhydroxybutyrate depolymerase
VPFKADNRRSMGVWSVTLSRMMNRPVLGNAVLSLVVAATVAGCHSSPTAPSAPALESLVSHGVPRTYTLHVPPGFQPNAGALIIALHGRTQTASSFESFSGLSVKADQAAFAVAYPDGLFQSGDGATNWAFFRNDYADDVGFLRDLVTALQASIHPDPRRIYVTGFSNGGRMAYRAGIELPDLVAAVGVVGGSLYIVEGGSAASVPAALGPVSVVMLQGEFDTPYCGGIQGGGSFASQDETFDYWTGALGNNCATVDPPAPLCDGRTINALASKSATNCRGNTQVVFYKLIGGNHFWYASPMNVAGQAPFNPALNAATGLTTNDILWNFFSAHPKS